MQNPTVLSLGERESRSGRGKRVCLNGYGGPVRRDGEIERETSGSGGEEEFHNGVRELRGQVN